MTISQAQLTVLILLVTGAIGFRRGWARAVVTTAIVLGTLLFLELGGGMLVTNLFVGASASGVNQAATFTCYNMAGSLSDLIFGGMTMLGYYAGNRHGTAPVSANQRMAGIVPGVITGGAIAFYLSQHIFPRAQGLLHTLDRLSFLAALPVLLGLGLLGLMIALFISHNGHKASKAH